MALSFDLYSTYKQGTSAQVSIRSTNEPISAFGVNVSRLIVHVRLMAGGRASPACLLACMTLRFRLRRARKGGNQSRTPRLTSFFSCATSHPSLPPSMHCSWFIKEEKARLMSHKLDPQVAWRPREAQFTSIMATNWRLCILLFLLIAFWLFVRLYRELSTVQWRYRSPPRRALSCMANILALMPWISAWRKEGAWLEWAVKT